MIDSRAELLRIIAELSELDPKLRLGQMLSSLATMARGPYPESIWDCEDEEFIGAARRLLQILKERRTDIAELERTIAAL